MTDNVIDVATNFSRYPAGRFLSDGPYSGEKFRETFLIDAVKSNKELTIQLDGTRGYGSSFLEEAFGGLVRAGIPAVQILNLIEFKSDDESLIIEIKEYIEDAEK